MQKVWQQQEVVPKKRREANAKSPGLAKDGKDAQKVKQGEHM